MHINFNGVKSTSYFLLGIKVRNIIQTNQANGVTSKHQATPLNVWEEEFVV